MSITITEALAEIKTIEKRLTSKRLSIAGFLARQDGVRDPLEREGGSAQFIDRERQSMRDLQERIIFLRRGIHKANDDTVVQIGDHSRTISDWLTWRRDVAPGYKAFLNDMRAKINVVRTQAFQQKASVVPAGGTPASANDYVVNIDERELAQHIEELEQLLGTLDGVLSLKNATVTIEE